MLDSPKKKGAPKVVSDTEGEEITPDNPEIVKQFPVDPYDQRAVLEAEGQVPADGSDPFDRRAIQEAKDAEKAAKKK